MPRRIQSPGIGITGIVLFSISQLWALSTEHFRRERQLDISALLGRPFIFGWSCFCLAYQPTRALKDTLDSQDIGPSWNLCTKVFTETGVLLDAACRLLANQLECPIREEASVLSCGQDVCAIGVLPFAWLKYRRSKGGGSGGRDIHGWRCHWSSGKYAANAPAPI